MKFITDYFKNRRLAKEKAEREALEYKKFIEEAIEHKKKHDEAMAKAALDERIRMESDIPWYQLVGAPYNIENPPLEPVTERYKWNKAFIRSLREQGFKGETDSQVIAEWEKKVETDKMRRMAELDREAKKKSNDPWIEVVSERYDETTKQVEIKLDWNTAFIKMLRENGYSGRDEQEIVDKWFKRLSEDIASDLHGAGYNG